MFAFNVLRRTWTRPGQSGQVKEKEKLGPGRGQVKLTERRKRKDLDAAKSKRRKEKLGPGRGQVKLTERRNMERQVRQDDEVVYTRQISS